MKIYALDSDNEEYQSLINSLAEKVSIDLFDDFESLLAEVDDDCQGILLDFDDGPRKKNKLIAKAKKSYSDLNIFLLANELDAKKLVKHQKSKTGAHVYFQTPLDDDLLDSLIEPFIDFAGETPLDEQEVLKEHQSSKPVSEAATGVSENIDGAFSAAFFDEYSGDSDEGEPGGEDSGLESLALDEVESDSPQEMSLDSADDEISLGDDADEINLEADDSSEISMDDGGVEEFSLDGDSSDDNSEWSEQEDLSLSDGEKDPEDTIFPDEDDLSFPEIDASAVQAESAAEETSPEDSFEMSLDEEEPVVDDSNELSVAADEVSLDDSFEMSLDEDEPASLDNVVDEMELGDSSDLVELSDIKTDEVVVDVDSANDLEMDLGSDLEFSLGGSDEVESAQVDPGEIEFGNVEEETKAEDGLVINDESTSASQVFNLEETKDNIKVEQDASEIQLGSDQEDDSAGDMNTNVGLISGMDEELDLTEGDGEEITRTQMNLSADGIQGEDQAEDDLSLTMPKSTFDDSNQDDIGDLLSQADDVSPTKSSIENEFEMPMSDESKIIKKVQETDMTGTGLTIQGVSLPEGLGEDISEKETGITMKHPVEQEAAPRDPENVTKTSIDMMDESLTSIDLPEAPDFSETVEKKLQEIDDLIEDEAEDDKTMVVSREDLETNFYSNQGISDTTIIQQNPIEEQPAQEDKTAIVSVSQDLKSEHRDYVQSHDEELVRLGETIKSLRLDREALQAKVSSLESHKDEENREVLDLQAQLDEKSIELVVIKKRMDKQVDDLRFQLDIALDKKEIIAKQNEKFTKEVEKLSRQKKLDLNKIRARERELEEKLEMLRRDAEVQIRNRDQKILELKRRIDTLEFDVESSHDKEKQSVDNQVDLQDKMDRVIKTLRGAIGQLEDDYGMDERKASIKKNLDI